MAKQLSLKERINIKYWVFWWFCYKDKSYPQNFEKNYTQKILSLVKRLIFTK